MDRDEPGVRLRASRHLCVVPHCSLAQGILALTAAVRVCGATGLLVIRRDQAEEGQRLADWFDHFGRTWLLAAVRANPVPGWFDRQPALLLHVGDPARLDHPTCL